MIEEVKIKVTSDNKGADDTIKKLEQIGAVDAKNAANFKKHNEAQKAQFKEAGQAAGKFASGVESQFSQLGAQIMGYMALDKLIGFLKDSVKEFIDAEKNAARLGFAIEVIGGQSAATTKKLLEQSAVLQENSIFSDDAIQQAQTALATYGLTGEQIEKLTPQILDLAAASGTDLASATETVIKGIEGQTKGLKLLGIGFKNANDPAKNLAIITEKLTKFQGASAAAMETNAGKAEVLSNRFGELKESIGSFLVEAQTVWMDMIDVVFGDFTAIVDRFQEIVNKEYSPKTIEIISKADALESEARIKLLDDAIKSLLANKASLANDYQDQTLSAAKYLAEIRAINDQIRILNLEKSKEPKKLGGDGDGGDGGGVDKLKDLTDQINAIYAQMWLDQLNLQRNALKQKALEDKKFADETITDIVARNQAILEIDQKLYDDLEVLDAAQINKKADDDKARALKEHSSQKQINELVLAIENKRVADIIALDEKYAQDKLTNEEQNWDLMLQQLDGEREDLVAKHKEKTEDLKKLEVERYKETQELRVALQKTGSKAEQAAKMQNLKEDFDKELQLLEITHDNKLMSDEDYLRKRALLYANYNKAVADSTKELAEKQKQDILDIFDLMSSAIFDRIEQMINQNIELIDRQQEMVRSDIEHQKRLAEEGRDNTLQESERQFAELEKQRIIQQEKLRKAKEFEILLNTVAEYSKTDPNTAIAKAIAQMALLKGAEALYMEEGGIIGETSQHSKIGGLGFSRLHPGGGDVLVHAQSGEGILSRDEMSNLGKSGFYDLKSMLSKPLRERQIPLVGVVGSSGFDKKEMAQGFNMVVDAIKSKKETHFEVDHMNNWVVTQIEHGMKEVVTHVNRKPRI
jgi:hypothetical protein